MDPVASTEKERSSVHVYYEDNKQMADLFQGKGLGDKVTLLVEIEVNNLSEHSIGGYITKIGASDSGEPDAQDLDPDSPVSVSFDIATDT